jgi:hypothetical protein
MRPRIPPQVLGAAHDRRAARIAGDWAEADRLRAVIEAAGWRVTDRGKDFALAPAHPPNQIEGDRVRYGSAASVPSRLQEAPTAAATIIVRAADQDVGGAMETLAGMDPTTQVVVVADAPGREASAGLERLIQHRSADRLEVAWTSQRLGPAASLNIGLRRAVGELVIALGPGTQVGPDVVPRLASVLAAGDVAVAGAEGLVGQDIRHLRNVLPGGSTLREVVALDGRCLAVRRELAAARGPIDERLGTWRHISIWWSLVLRDQGEGRVPLRALLVVDLPIAGGPPRGVTGQPGEATGDDARMATNDGARVDRRDRYRLLERFGHRPELFNVPPEG